MIFNERSKFMLKYEKTTLKLIEFSIEKEHYPQYPLDADDLIFTTIYVLSRYCEELIRNSQSKEFYDLKEELIIVSQYYDVATKTKSNNEYNNDFLLLGTVSYFLSENFGSAKVLVDKIDKTTSCNDNLEALLYNTLVCLLTGNWVEFQTTNEIFKQYSYHLRSHFIEGKPIDKVLSILLLIKESIFDSNNIIDINLIDYLFATIICAKEHSAWILLPQYSNNTIHQWEQYLSKKNSLKLLWPSQKVMLEHGALLGKDLIVPLPTGVGKTKSIEILLRSKFIDEGTKTAVIIAPLRALCNEITMDLVSAFDKEVTINQFSDTMQNDFLLELAKNKKYVFICTPEKFSYLLRHEPDFIECVDVFIFDEAHLFDDNSRGIQYELLISEIARKRNKFTQMILFSAVLSNAMEIQNWLFGEEGSTVNHTLVKSTDKSIGFLSTDKTIHYFEKENMEQESYFVPKSIVPQTLKLFGKERKEKIFPEMKSQDIAIYYAIKLCKQAGVAVFAGQARSILPIVKRICDINERGYSLANLIKEKDISEVNKLNHLFSLHYGRNHEFTKASKLGVFPHYADLDNGLKLAIEYALRRRYISLVICTTTLAEGVNIPIKYLFITTFSQGNSKIQVRKMQNLIGRTARSGIYTEGSTIITDCSFYDKRSEWKGGGRYKWNDCKQMFSSENAEACLSTILLLVNNFDIDYEWHYDGEALITHIVENYEKDNCFELLIDNIEEGYKEKIENESRYNHYKGEIEKKVHQIEQIVLNIENYLCYLFEEITEENFLDVVERLASQTFGYYLGDDKQKDYILLLFRTVGQKILSKINSENKYFLSKSLYGVDISIQILEIIGQKVDTLRNSSEIQLIEELLEIYMEIFKNSISYEQDELFTAIQLWISGNTYIEIFEFYKEVYTMYQIEKLCNKIISFKFCYFIGSVIDAIDSDEEDLINSLVIFQKKIKYGASSLNQVFICENVFDDRVVSKEISRCIRKPLLSRDELKLELRSKRADIQEILKDYPEYFSFKLKNFLK